MTKPSNLIYGLEDRPPLSVLAALSIQHIFLMSSTLVLPVALVTEIGGSLAEVQATVAMTMLACGIGTILQAARWRGIGSGYLCPNLCGPNFFAASIGAAWLGGLPLMKGMTIVAGLVEVVFGRIAHRLAFLFPAEITGLVVFMVAFNLVPLGASKFLGVNYAGDPIQPKTFAIAAITLLVMVGINVWGSKQLKLYAILIGLVVGFGLSIGLGVLTSTDLRSVAEARWIGLPSYDGMWSYSFRWSLVPLFVIVSICGALKSFGNLVLCEKANDSDWKQPDVERIGNGLVADGYRGPRFRGAWRRRFRHVRQQRRFKHRVRRDEPVDCRRCRRPVLSAGPVAETDVALGDHAECRRRRHSRARGLLHDGLRHPDHPKLADGYAANLRYRHRADIRHEPGRSAGIVFAHLLVDAAAGRIVADAVDGSCGRGQSAVADRLEAPQTGRENPGRRNGTIARLPLRLNSR